MSCETSPVIPEAPETQGVPSKPEYVKKTLAGTDVEQMSEASVRFQKATFYAFKSFTANVPANNVGTIYFGFRNTDFVHSLAAGQSKVIEAPRGQKFDLATMYVKGTAADALVIEYS